jgi:uncharacterized protein YbjT (DUF2867 family)
MPLKFEPVIPIGSVVLVTGANGLIAGHVVDQLLKAGYKVRGSVRNLEKNQWMYDIFDKKYGKGQLELVKVEDLAATGAFDEALKGLCGPSHTPHF